MTDSLVRARVRASPRLRPSPTPIISSVIHTAVLVLWVMLLLLVFGRGGVFAWSIGLVYLGYDAALQIFTGWQIRRLPRSVPETGVVTGLTLTVLIAAHNEVTVLPETLSALLSQTDTPNEIIIADDGSSDGTAEMLCSRYGLCIPPLGDISAPVRLGSTDIRWCRLPHGGKAAALNTAIFHTSADIILTVDADTLVESGSIQAVRQAFWNEPQLVGVTGIITPRCRSTAMGQMMQWFQTYEYIRNFLARYAWMQVNCLQLISGAFAGFRRHAVVDVGGFDDDCFVEDYELVARMYRYAGQHSYDWRFRVLGNAQAYTEAPSSVPAFLRQRQRWFGGFLQTQWWYRDMVGNSRYGRLGTVMLPVKAVDTVAPLFGLTAFIALIYFLVTGQLAIVWPVAVIIIGKLLIDIVFHLWALRRYRRWINDPGRGNVLAIVGELIVEPFTFTLLLHLGALLGWVAAISGAQRWVQDQRFVTWQ